MVFSRRAFAAFAVAGVVLPAASAARIQAVPRSSCSKTFTVDMFSRAVHVAYRGVRVPSRRDLGRLAHFLECSREPWTQSVDRRVWVRVRHANWRRRHPPCTWQLASWYSDGGATASGWHATFGVANKWLPFGTRVHFSYGGRSVWAVVDDRGPYVGARAWDLNQNTAGALGFGGVGDVCASVPG